jgi:hypothetical protein
MIEQPPAFVRCDGCGAPSPVFEADDDEIELDDDEEDNRLPIEWVAVTMTRKIVNPAFDARPAAVASLATEIMTKMQLPPNQRMVAEIQAEAAIPPEARYVQVEDVAHFCATCRYGLGEIGVEVDAYSRDGNDGNDGNDGDVNSEDDDAEG